MTATIEAATAGGRVRDDADRRSVAHGASTGRNVDTGHWVSVQYARRIYPI